VGGFVCASTKRLPVPTNASPQPIILQFFQTQHLIVRLISQSLYRLELSIPALPDRLKWLHRHFDSGDIKPVIDGGKQVDLEMQASSIEEKVLNEHISLKRKTIYYLCDLHSSQSSKGKAYNKLVQTYQVTFCSYTVFPQRPAFLNKFSMRAEDGFLFSNDIQAIFIELSKIDKILEKSVNELSPIEMWSIFLRYANIPEFRNNVNEVIKAREVMSVATELLTSISQDEKEKAIFRSRKMFQSDLESNILTAEERGEERGIAIGEARGIAIGEAKHKASINKIAQDMKKNNISIAPIASITGLSAEAIEKL